MTLEVLSRVKIGGKGNIIEFPDVGYRRRTSRRMARDRFIALHDNPDNVRRRNALKRMALIKTKKIIELSNHVPQVRK